MNPIAQTALALRNELLGPSRRRTMKRLAQERRCPISVSFYHRVADTHPNGWTISKNEFIRHLDHYQRYFDVIGLDEVQRRVRHQDSPRPSVSITFDDGYRDNMEFAIATLVDRGLPCTYFVSTGHIVDQKPFTHDSVAGCPLPVNTTSDLRQMAEAGIEIGCHTRNHVDLSTTTDPESLRSEIIDDKDELEQIIGRPVRYFAFPFGLPAQLTGPAIDAVIDAGFDGFCSAFGAYNLVGRDDFHVRRFHGDPEFARLKNWLSFDPAKVTREPNIAYRHVERPAQSNADPIAGLNPDAMPSPAVLETIS